MRFLLFVEDNGLRGAIADYVKRLLDKRLSQPVRVTPIGHNGKSDYLGTIRRKVKLHLCADSGSDVIAAIGLLDLWTFEESIRQLRNLSGVEERWQAAKEHIEKLVQQPKFRQHFAVQEVEAWLIASPQIFPPDARRDIDNHAAKPEAIGGNESPARLLARVYQKRLNRDYRKVIDGASLFSDADPQHAYEACPHFKRMLDDMEQLAKERGL